MGGPVTLRISLYGDQLEAMRRDLDAAGERTTPYGEQVLSQWVLMQLRRPDAAQEEWSADDRVTIRDELVTQELPDEERHYAEQR